LARDARAAAPSVFSSQFPLLARRPKVIEAWEQPSRPARDATIPVGSRVFHQKFGYGVVTATEDDRLDIAFDKSGAKRVLDRFVEKAET
jgi:DNA helicase-2/ATP-dependent DNA helicase PcrA